jgi:hypothetical protein
VILWMMTIMEPIARESYLRVGRGRKVRDDDDHHGTHCAGVIGASGEGQEGERRGMMINLIMMMMIKPK